MFCGREVTNISITNVNLHDYPDFSDAYFDYAEWADSGMPLNEVELDEFTEVYGDVVNEMAHEYMWDAAESAYEMDR